MARSLTIKNTEKPATSRLFNVFILIAMAWLMAGMLVAGLSVGDAAATETPVVLDLK